jgi:hypothetical protein
MRMMCDVGSAGFDLALLVVLDSLRAVPRSVPLDSVYPTFLARVLSFE